MSRGLEFESWVMHFAHVIQSRNVRTRLGALGDFDCGSFPAVSQITQPFELDELYGLLD